MFTCVLMEIFFSFPQKKYFSHQGFSKRKNNCYEIISSRYPNYDHFKIIISKLLFFKECQRVSKVRDFTGPVFKVPGLLSPLQLRGGGQP